MGSHKTKNQISASQAQFVQSPLTTAVRGALFASSAAVVFGVPSALAGDIPAGCVHTNLETVTCAGSTAVPLVVNTTVQPAPINDLTIVIGDSLDPAGTTVNILAPGEGAIAESLAFGDASVINHSDITTYAGHGVIADADLDATVVNNGTIVANYGIGAIAAANYGNAVITNNGSITANDYSALGALGVSTYNDVIITNNGDITANGSDSALGILAISKYEDATVAVADGGSVNANGNNMAYGVVVVSGFDSPNDYATATIAGAVTATAGYNAGGVYVGGSNMTVSVAGTGVVTANAGSSSAAYANAVGVITGFAEGAYIDVSVDGAVHATAASVNNSEAIGLDIVGVDFYNEGTYSVAEILVSNTGANSISATATVYGEYATATAEGVYIEGGPGTVIDVYNSGAITATATASDAYTNAWNSTARATGVAVDAYDGLTITNAVGGNIAAYATTNGVWGDAYAEGITASTQYGALAIVNDGAVNATATANLDDAQATGIRAWNYDGNTSITGSGTVSATANAYEGAYAEGITAWSYNGDITIDGATVTASANADNDGDADAGARGVNSYTWYGNTSISNLNVTVDAEANSNYANADSEARGVRADTYWNSGGYIEIDGVTANVTAEATGYIEAYAEAWGIQASTGDQNLRIDNSDLTVTANASAIYDEAEADARGIDAYSRYGNINIYGALINVSATASSAYFEAEADATGIEADTSWYGSGDVYIESVDVTVAATATGYVEAEADAEGIDVSTGYGNVRIVNATVMATASATTTNAAADEADADAEAINAGSRDGNIYLRGITATARTTANGFNEANADSEVLDLYSEYGNILIYDAEINGYADATSMYEDADAEVKGIEADTWLSGYIEIDTVTINVSATANGDDDAYAEAWGIDADGDQGVFIYNANVTAAATANAVYDEAEADAWGINAYSEDGNVSIYNATVDVTAMATSVYGEAEADARGLDASTYNGYVEIGGVDATVVAGAYAEDESDATATGIDASTWGGNISIYDSSADVSATAATANERADAEATGIRAYSYYGNISVDVGAGNVVSATATASASGYGWATADATGVGIDTDGDVVFSNSGDISANATASANPDYGWGSADAIGVYIEGGYSSTVTATNDGSISATAYGDGAWATGMFVRGDDTTIYAEIPYSAPLTVINNGNIYATATGIGENKYAIATGIEARGTGDTVNVVNGADGVVIATANATGAYSSANAIAVHVSSNGDKYSNVTNHGLLAAYATGAYTEAFAVYAEGDAQTTIDNYGTMVGAIRTGGGNDVVNNFSNNTWFATGVSSFGGGDDTINNIYTNPYTYGHIVMTDATIDLGGYASGNQFNNQGLLEAFGDNIIDMGNNGPYAPNPYAFNNYDGYISLADGDTSDSLTIIGDFAGGGYSSLIVDVDGAAGTSDMLNITGDVSGITTVNPILWTMPNSPSTVIDVVNVGGYSAAGNFVLGDVYVNPDSLLTFDFDVFQSQLDDPDDVFSLGIDVTGLSDPGVLASSLSPAIQNLWQTGVGTLHQRQGAVRDQLLEKVSVWLRTFGTDGTLDPDGAQSNLEFDQENTGYELGIDAALNEELRLGLLIGRSEADIDLNDAVGSADIDGDTWGIYLTWMGSNDWYADLSYRRMDFDGKAKSTAAPMDIDGEADGWNLEVGRTYTLDSGLVVEPQFQYTDMEVDMDDIVNSSGVFSQKDGDSTQARLGVMLRKGYQSGNAKWTPYGSLSVVEEFDGENSFNIGGAYAGESDIGGTSMLVETGVNAQFGDIIIYGGLNYQDGDALDSILGGQLGVRFSW